MRRAGWMLLPTAVVVAGVAGVAAAGPGSPVTVAYAAYGDGRFGRDGNNDGPIVASVNLPRGNYALNGKVSVRWDSGAAFDNSFLIHCTLLQGKKKVVDLGESSDGDTVIALQGIAKLASPTTIAIQCDTDAAALAHHARLTAIKVTRVRFQSPG